MSNLSSTQMTIAELIDANVTFEIPNYQRGYRWGKTEVVDLLDDIMDVVKEDVTTSILRDRCKARPYCLQPIAFDPSKEEQKTMIVVDGQQRLTTIFLILKYIAKRFHDYTPETLEELEIDNPDEFYKEIILKYEDPTRNAVFDHVKSNLNEQNTENIDAFYITEAYSYICAWGEKNIKKAAALNKFSIKFFYGTSVIWYEIDQNTDGTPNDYFAKTNTGRIPLTNSELIKANLMLDEYCIKKEVMPASFADDAEKGKKEDELRRLNMERLENQRIKISRQWDTIEAELRNDEFWYFLTEDSDKYEDTRIDYIFDIVAKELYGELNLDYDSIDEFFSLNKERGAFIIIARYLKEFEECEGEDPVGVYVWKKAWNTYMTFREWFDNREWYHFIGYILSADYDCTAEDILSVFRDNTYLSKSQIKARIVEIIETICCITNEDGTKKSLDEYKSYLSELNYEKEAKKVAIKKTLFLFNVISVLNDNKEISKTSRDTFFPFSRYKKEKWNLEHIHSKEDDSFKKEFAKEYMRYIAVMLERLEGDQAANSKEIEILKSIQNAFEQKKSIYETDGIDAEEAGRRATQESAEIWVEAYADDLDDAYINGIGNMALLDETTNKSYHNAPFFMKRMIISDIVMGKKEDISRFIPFCTRNVFDKTYTKLPSAMLHWNQHDYDDYMEAISEVIYTYFEGGEE